MSFRFVQDGTLLPDDYDNAEEAMSEAKELATDGAPVLVLEAVAWVKMAPTVIPLKAVPPLPPGPVYRGVEPAAEPEGPPRVPQATPRLLIVDRKATPAELVGHLMVIAKDSTGEMRIVKNAFGALELADMPLKSEELLEVKRAMGPG